ncbi:MAG: glycine cleavage system protein GcvH [Clostridiales bacterium]|jgi:glycine cleavage system H protein|nr:glycine cleavage system protein GcvH [Clostridiales bacterium]
MSIPNDYFFTETHEWVKFTDNGTALIGISDHAQEEMGDVAFVNLPSVGDAFAAGDTLCDIESIKAVSDVYCPVAGSIKVVNDELSDSPEKINEAPYDAWLVEIECNKDTSALMDAAAYEAFLA